MNNSIKIIKHGDRKPPEQTNKAPGETTKTANQVRREIAQTVASWIKARHLPEQTG